MADVRVLASGVDSLYFSAGLEPRAEVLDAVEKGRTTAQEQGGEVPLLLDEYEMLLKPFGHRQYRYWLSSHDMDMVITQSKKPPAVYVQLPSGFLHEVGYVADWEKARELIREHLATDQRAETKISRLDLYCDFQGWVPVLADEDRFVCRASEDHSYRVRRELSGFMWGRGTLVARLYDKTREILKSDKAWFEDVWGAARDPAAPVWRLEFQQRREMLTECRLSTVEDALGAICGLWAYCTEWLSPRSPRPTPSGPGGRCRRRGAELPSQGVCARVTVGVGDDGGGGPAGNRDDQYVAQACSRQREGRAGDDVTRQSRCNLVHVAVETGGFDGERQDLQEKVGVMPPGNEAREMSASLPGVLACLFPQKTPDQAEAVFVDGVRCAIIALSRVIISDRRWSYAEDHVRCRTRPRRSLARHPGSAGSAGAGEQRKPACRMDR